MNHTKTVCIQLKVEPDPATAEPIAAEHDHAHHHHDHEHSTAEVILNWTFYKKYFSVMRFYDGNDKLE